MAGQWGSANDPRLALAGNSGLGTPTSPGGGVVDPSANLMQQHAAATAAMAGGQPAQLPPPPSGTTGTPQPGVTTPPPETQTAMSPPPGEYSQFGNNPGVVTPPPPGGGVIAPPPGAGGAPGMPPGYDPNAPNQYGGQTIAGADPSQADYNSVQGYADQAYQQARRSIDPMQEQQSRRMEQDLINKGIDPSSEQGMAMLDQQNRNFTDQNNAATFGALQFGQGIQNQMAQQEQQKAALAGQMQQGLWGQELGAAGLDMQGYLGKMQNELGYANNATARYGIAQGANTAAAAQANQRYGMDQNYELGMGSLDVQRNQTEHGQLMDFLGYDMNVNQYNQQQQMIQDAMYNQQYSSVPIPGMSAVNPYGAANQYLSAGNTKYGKTGGQFEGKYGF